MNNQFPQPMVNRTRWACWSTGVSTFTALHLVVVLLTGCQGEAPHVAENAGAFGTLGSCTNTCEFANDGVCDDGGPNSFSRSCDVGTDCGDCGIRANSSSTEDPFAGDQSEDNGANNPIGSGASEANDPDDPAEGADNATDDSNHADSAAGTETDPADDSLETESGAPESDEPQGGGGFGGGFGGAGGGGGGTPAGGGPVADDPPAEPIVTPDNGDYSRKYVALENTSEAELMVRVGDIDNLNFGFDEFFDPFSGNVTPPHEFPWALDPADPEGTDRIMVVTSYVGKPEDESDGYSRDTSRPENSVRPITLEYSLEGRALAGAIIQIFIDDLQAPRWGADYKITLNGLRARFMESRLNVLDQNGPVGQLISIDVPDEFMPEISSGRLEIKLDDLTTGAGDGYAVDFVKLLINPYSVSQTGQLVGQVIDGESGGPIEGATVVSGGSASDITDVNGEYVLNEVPAGLAIVEVTREGYEPLTQSVTLIEDEVAQLDFELRITP